MSFLGATGTPVLDFWWRLLWVSTPEWVLPYSLFAEANVMYILRDPPLVLHIANLLTDDIAGCWQGSYLGILLAPVRLKHTIIRYFFIAWTIESTERNFSQYDRHSLVLANLFTNIHNNCTYEGISWKYCNKALYSIVLYCHLCVS